ncbi:MAG: META domain-containing protein [Acidimicrobiales bacterium]
MAGLMALLGAGCARTGYAAEPDPVFDATWTVESMVIDGEPVDLASDVIVVDIDTSLASVEAATGCRTLFGSFTFLDDGRAGFTLPGGTKPACDDDTEPWLLAIDRSFASAIGAVETWSTSGDELTLSGPDSELVLLRAG